MKAITNARIILNNRILRGYTIIFDEKIEGIREDTDIDRTELEQVVDAEGRYLSPGFINIHIHGCLGWDTMDDDGESLWNISKSIATTGVTAFLPTTMTMEQSAIELTLNRIKKLMGSEPGASILGCHLEGPFINEKYKGAQDPRHIRRPDFKSIEGFLDVIRIITLAPEEEGACEFIENCTRHGVLTAIGHTGASYEQAMEAINSGAGLITHIFNTMPPLHHRKPGVVGAALDSGVVCELIADNIHVDPVVQRILLKVKGIEGIVLVTDSMRACMLDEGEYDLGGQKVTVKGEEARLASGNLAGSVLTLNKALRNFRENTGVTMVEAIRTVTENPARILDLEGSKGSLLRGRDADMVLLDEEFNIYGTFVKGNKVYERI